MNHPLTVLALIGLVNIAGCSAGTRATPTLSFTQYGLDSGAVDPQTKSDVTIGVRALRITDIYDHPDMFAFSLDNLPGYADNATLRRYYPRDHGGQQWEYWFASPDASEQLLILWVDLRNDTDHILRMNDARIYLVPEQGNPIPPIGSFDSLLTEANRFWQMQVRQVATQTSLFNLPPGFVRDVVGARANAFELVNDVGREILPGFKFSGMLAFPVVRAGGGTMTLTFFDITTKTDAAGTPTEKTRFDFALHPERVQMYFDVAAMRWRPGVPPLSVSQP